jgi:hypothetical protein
MNNTSKVQVCWLARDYEYMSEAKHHFILIMLPNGFTPWNIYRTICFQGIRFITLGTCEIGGEVVLDVNNQEDVEIVEKLISKRVFENLNNPENGRKYRYLVKPPRGNNMEFADVIIRLVQNYEKSTKVNPIKQESVDQNYTAWINTLLKVAGVSKKERVSLGRRWGISSSKQSEIPREHFL